MSRLTPLSQLRISRYHIPAHGLIPNTSISKQPLTLYHAAFASATASQIEAHLESIGVVSPAWRYTMYSFDHFHSTSHEVLCVYSGKAKLCFGGETNPDRVELEAQKGDVMILPAGVSHRLLEEIEPPFQMIGSYPKGLAFDMCYGKPGEEGKIEGISKLRWFDKDPIYGDNGPTLG